MEPNNTQSRALNSQARNDLSNRGAYLDYEAMKSEVERLTTFYEGPVAWQVRFIDPADCARAGFFFLKNDDRVQCIFCRGIVGEWDEGDTPMGEHRRHFPRCPFILNLPVGNIPIGDEGDVHQRDPSVLGVDVTGHGHFGQGPGRRHSSQAAPRTGAPQQLTGSFDDMAMNLSIEPCRGPTHLHMVTQQSRQQSYLELSWPSSAGQTPEKMSEAGFYYIGPRDHVKCFYCGGGIKSWEARDDPWVEHAKWFPRCTFVILNKGHDFIKSVLDNTHPRAASGDAAATGSSSRDEEIVVKRDARADMEAGSASGGSSSNGLEKGLSSGSSDPDLSSSGNSSGEEEDEHKPRCKGENLKEEVRKLREARECKICLDNEISVLFLPCGHLVSCTACATSMTKCALCRKKIKAVVRAYM